eukprot:m.150297 g.150297  ORF g.150297 m.150297 type:complete len:366 (-) comp16314_c0_seq2:1996-3093(-)
MASGGRSLGLMLIGFILGVLLTYYIQLNFILRHNQPTDPSVKDNFHDVPLRYQQQDKITTAGSTTKPTVRPSVTTLASAVPKALSLEQRLQLNYSHDDLTRLAVPESGKWTVKHGHYGPIVDIKHKLVFCSIPKAACTIWRQMMRRLNGATDYDTSDERITHHYGGMSSGLTYLASYTSEQADNIMTDPEFLKVAVVRNPYSRLLSAWRDKFGPGSAHNWGNLPWLKFVNSYIGTTCNEEEHWAPMSCFCGLRRWRYDLVAKMEGSTMDALGQVLVAKGRVPPAMMASGWGKHRNESFLGTNRVFHRTGADERLVEYYSKTTYPGAFAKVKRAVAEDVVRFQYQHEEQHLTTVLEERHWQQGGDV